MFEDHGIERGNIQDWEDSDESSQDSEEQELVSPDLKATLVNDCHSYR